MVVNSASVRKEEPAYDLPIALGVMILAGFLPIVPSKIQLLSANLHNIPVFYFGCSFVPTHFSLETMMTDKIIACLERNFQRWRESPFIKGRGYSDLLWFMQSEVRPLEKKLVKDGETGPT